MFDFVDCLEEQRILFDELDVPIDPEYIQPDIEIEGNVEILRDIVTPVVNFEIAKAVNNGRDNAVTNIDGVEIQAAEWSAILDDGTCPFCEEMDTRIISVNDPQYVECQPPAHGGCRCIFVYITTEEESVEPDWVPLDSEERIRFRIFDLYNTDDLDNYLEVLEKQSFNLFEKEMNFIREEVEVRKQDIEIRQDIENIDPLTITDKELSKIYSKVKKLEKISPRYKAYYNQLNAIKEGIKRE